MTAKEEVRIKIDLLRQEYKRMAAEYVSNHPELTLAEIAIFLGDDPADLSRHAHSHGVTRPRGAGSPAAKKGEQHER